MSQFLDDLIKSSTFLNQNLAQLKINRTISTANDAVQQIKSAESDEQQKTAQLRQLANGLVMDLTKYGAPAETVQMLSQQISPQRFFQTAEQVAINPDMASPGQIDAAKGILDEETSLKRDALTAKKDQAQLKADQKLDDRVFKAVEMGQKRIDTVAKKSLEAIDSASTMKQLLDSGNPIADSAVQTFAVRASGEVGNLTDAERRPYGGSQAIMRRIQSYAKKAANGKLTDADRKDLYSLSDMFEQAGKRNLRGHQERVGKQIAANLGVKPEQVFEKLIPDWQAGTQPQTQGGSPGVTVKKMRNKQTGEIVEVQFDAQGKPLGVVKK